ncbi:mucin-binding protein [Pediococcus ethanolidurans]|uniref:mucin-binding protein n=1 Tax=Pediococcus ethanolidurans TaxID=319653 RepID=UPI00295402AB|nr:hypothetical protein [Pediococcus ethanolidurans]
MISSDNTIAVEDVLGVTAPVSIGITRIEDTATNTDGTLASGTAGTNQLFYEIEAALANSGLTQDDKWSSKTGTVLIPNGTLATNLKVFQGFTIDLTAKKLVPENSVPVSNKFWDVSQDNNGDYIATALNTLYIDPNAVVPSEANGWHYDFTPAVALGLSYEGIPATVTIRYIYTDNVKPESDEILTKGTTFGNYIADEQQPIDGYHVDSATPTTGVITDTKQEVTIQFVPDVQTTNIQFVDDDNGGVQVGDSIELDGVTNGSTAWTVTVPTGYQLADGQAKSGTYTFAANNNANIVIHLVHKLLNAQATYTLTGTVVDENNSSLNTGTTSQSVNFVVDESTGKETVDEGTTESGESFNLSWPGYTVQSVVFDLKTSEVSDHLVYDPTGTLDMTQYDSNGNFQIEEIYKEDGVTFVNSAGDSFNSSYTGDQTYESVLETYVKNVMGYTDGSTSWISSDSTYTPWTNQWTNGQIGDSSLATTVSFTGDLTINVAAGSQTTNIQYVDDDNDGKQVGGLTPLTGITDSTTDWKADVPTYYKLADGQASSGTYTFSAIDNANVVIHLIHTHSNLTSALSLTAQVVDENGNIIASGMTSAEGQYDFDKKDVSGTLEDVISQSTPISLTWDGYTTHKIAVIQKDGVNDGINHNFESIVTFDLDNNVINVYSYLNNGFSYLKEIDQYTLTGITSYDIGTYDPNGNKVTLPYTDGNSYQKVLSDNLAVLFGSDSSNNAWSSANANSQYSVMPDSINIGTTMLTSNTTVTATRYIIRFDCTADPQSTNIQYVDDDNNEAQVGDLAELDGVTNGTTDWTATAPTGYQLADEQVASGTYTFAASDNANIVIHLVHAHTIKANAAQTTDTVVYTGAHDATPANQTVTIQWTSNTDNVTNKVVWTTDVPSTTIATPTVSGYTPDQS